MNKFIFLFFFSLLSINVFGQFTDLYWKVGRGAALDFRSGTATMNTLDNCNSTIKNTSTSICNFRGDVIFYSNACKVYNRNNDTMLNGSGFNHGTISDQYVNTDFYPPWKGAVIIPFPNDTNKFYMFYENMEWNINGVYLPQKLYYLVVDRALNGGLGDVTLKDQTVISNDTLTFGEVLAVKHSNGKSWWIICRKYESDLYYKILVDSSGVHVPTTQHIGVTFNQPQTMNVICNSSLQGNKLVFSYESTLSSPHFYPSQIDLLDPHQIFHKSRL